MVAWLRRALVVVLAVLAAAYAHRPLLGVGFLGDDARTLVELHTTLDEEGALAYWHVDALHGRPLAAWSLALSKDLHARQGRYTPGDAGRLRLEGLALLVIAALGLRVSVRRGLAPWTGDEHGRAAGFTAAVLLMVHPLAIPAAAHLGDRGDMLALAFGLWAIAVYLYFRQAHSPLGVAVAWLLTLASAASSPLAYGLPVVLGVLELASADRHRSLTRRWRTAGTTILAFTVAVLVERGLRAVIGGEASHVAHVDRSPLALLGVAAEKLGVFVLPVNTTGVGVLGYVLAVLAVLAALHPGFVAARAAPRLWGRILGSWAACIGALLVLTWSLRSAPAELGDARSLLPGAALMAAGLGVASTALSGARRTLLPALAICVYAPLAAGSAATIEEAALCVGETHAALLEAGEERDWDLSVIVLDPPRKVAGVAALRAADEYALAAAPFLPRAGRPFDVEGMPSAALRLWSLGPELEAARLRGTTFLVEGTMESAGAADTSDRAVAADMARRKRGAWVALELPRVSPGVGALRWTDVGASPSGVVFDPWRARALRAIPKSDPTRDLGAPVLRFTPEVGYGGAVLHGGGALDGGPVVGSVADGHQILGAWVRGESGWYAEFDLERHLAWLLAGSVRSIWLPGLLASPEEVHVLASMPPIQPAVRPRLLGRDWVFDITVAAPERALDESTWVLALFDPIARTYEERPAELDGGRLRFMGVARTNSVRWSLERRVDGVTVARGDGVY
jgi:hypothetical protein